jgi:hypothetical protein
VRSDFVYDRGAATGGANPREQAHRPNDIPHISPSALWCSRQSTHHAPLYVQSKSQSLGCDRRPKTHTKPPLPDLTDRRPPTAVVSHLSQGEVAAILGRPRLCI